MLDTAPGTSGTASKARGAGIGLRPKPDVRYILVQNAPLGRCLKVICGGAISGDFATSM